jgi:tRNA A-37 threonylcarbamoyl transferase component Bud32
MSYANAEILPAVKLSDMFERFWNVAENWVDEPNSRRRGSSGVIRATFDGDVLYIKKQVNHLHYSVPYPLGRPTALREAEAIAAAREIGINVPEIIYCDSRRIDGEHHTILVTKALQGFLSLDDFVAQAQNHDELDNYKLIRDVASTLAILHRNRWQHGALYAKHIFVRKQGRHYKIALIDLEKMRRRLTFQQASLHDIDQLSRHQACWDRVHWQQFLDEYQKALSVSR